MEVTTSRALRQRREGARATRPRTWWRPSTSPWIASGATSRSAMRRAKSSSAGRSSATACTGSPAVLPSSVSRRATPSRSCSTTAGSSFPRSGGGLARGSPILDLQTSAPEQIQYLLSDAKSRIAIAEKAFLDPDPGCAQGPAGPRARDRRRRRRRRSHLDEVMEMDPEFDPAESVEALGPDDLLT